jgi:hypothetical protein
MMAKKGRSGMRDGWGGQKRYTYTDTGCECAPR